MLAADLGGSLGRPGGNTVKILKHLNRANISIALNNIQALFTNINSLHLHNNHLRWELLVPFYRWEN